MLKKIIVACFHGYVGPYEHNTEFKYSKKKESEIIHNLRDAGLNAQLIVSGSDRETLIIYSDTGRFRQR